MGKVCQIIDDYLDKSVVFLLVISVLGMLGMTVINIVLRWFNSHILWFEPAVRYLVLLSTFLGGAVATAKRRHIGIDLIGKYLESFDNQNLQRWFHRFIDMVGFITCLLLVKACSEFVAQEAQYGRDDVFLGIHAQYVAMILPFGFGLIGLRFILNILLSLTIVKEKK